MDYEKAYKEAMSKMAEFFKKYDGTVISLDGTLYKDLQNIFPKLKESEDERARKLCEVLVRTCFMNELCTKEDKDECLKWLEKQVPIHLSHDDENMIRHLTEYFTTGKELQNTNDTVIEWLEDIKRKLEKQGEQKPEWGEEDERILKTIIINIENLQFSEEMREKYHHIPNANKNYYRIMADWLKSLKDRIQDKTVLEVNKEDTIDNTNKVEPKFHEGEWVVSPMGVYWHIDKISNNRYEVTSNTGASTDWLLYTKIYHKFTIQDAKDGDVLASDNGCIILVKESRGPSWGYRLSYHCAVLHDGTFEPREFHVNPEKFFPATKEQHDLLFQKMKEEGYEWNPETKELNKLG